MTLSYDQLLHDVGLRMNALVGAQFSPLETTYAITGLAAANFKSADWPFSSFRDAILMAEEQIAWAIAATPSHPWRASLNAQSAALASAAALPKLDATNHPIIGVYGGVVDTGGTPCVAQPIEVVKRLLQETWRTYPASGLFVYAMDGNRIYHTRAGVLINCCIYDRTTQAAAWGAAGNTVLPDVLEGLIAALAISLMTRDNAYAAQASIYAQYASVGLAAIAAGALGLPTIPLPSQVPAATAS